MAIHSFLITRYSFCMITQWIYFRYTIILLVNTIVLLLTSLNWVFILLYYSLPVLSCAAGCCDFEIRMFLYDIPLVILLLLVVVLVVYKATAWHGNYTVQQVFFTPFRVPPAIPESFPSPRFRKLQQLPFAIVFPP